MIEGLSVLILLTTLSLHQTAEVPQQIPLIVANLGENINLTCSVSGTEAWLFFWYKMKFGYMVQTLTNTKGASEDIKLQGQFDDPRYTIRKDDDLYTLTIRNISKEDEATYFCQAGEPYIIAFINGTVLAVKDHKNQQKHIYVKQSPETASVQPGNPTTLQCSLLSTNKENLVQCPGEHSVHWFRAGSGRSHPSFIYTQSSRRDGQEEKSCVYSLSKTIHNSSDAGTYYCALVTCGEILFGGGTKVEMRQEQLPLVIALGTLMLCCMIAIVALILFRKKKTVCEHCKGAVTASHPDGSAEDQPIDADGDAAAMNYAALGFNSRKATRWNNRNSPEDCTYSSIRNTVRQ